MFIFSYWIDTKTVKKLRKKTPQFLKLQGYIFLYSLFYSLKITNQI